MRSQNNPQEDPDRKEKLIRYMQAWQDLFGYFPYEINESQDAVSSETDGVDQMSELIDLEPIILEQLRQGIPPANEVPDEQPPPNSTLSQVMRAFYPSVAGGMYVLIHSGNAVPLGLVLLFYSIVILKLSK